MCVLLAPVIAQAGVAEQSLTHANAKARAAVLHDVCEVHGNEKRDQLDAEDRAAYASILKELQRSLDTNDDPEVATQTFCSSGEVCKSPRPNRISPSGLFEGRGFTSSPPLPPSATMPTRIAVRNQQHANYRSLLSSQTTEKQDIVARGD